MYPTYMKITGIGSGEIVADEEYPDTAFRRASWSAPHTCPPRTLVYVRSRYDARRQHLQIFCFYSKSGDKSACRHFSTHSEQMALRGKGQVLLCSVMATVPAGTTVTLDASGSCPRQEQALLEEASEMTCVDLEKDFCTIVEQDKVPRETRTALVQQWVALQMTKLLVGFYKEKFGFQTVKQTSIWDAQMSGSIEDIRRGCSSL